MEKLESEKQIYLSHFRSAEGFKVSGVNRALSSLHGGSPEIMITVPLTGFLSNRKLDVFSILATQSSVPGQI